MKYLKRLIQHRNHILQCLDACRSFLEAKASPSDSGRSPATRLKGTGGLPCGCLFSCHQCPIVPLSQEFSPLFILSLSFPLSCYNSRVILFTPLCSQKWQSRGFCVQALHSRLITDGTSSFSMNKSGLFCQSSLGLYSGRNLFNSCQCGLFPTKIYCYPIKLMKAT